MAHLRHWENFPALNEKTGAASLLGQDKLVSSHFLNDTNRRMRDKWTDNLYVYSRGDQLDLLQEQTVADASTSFTPFDELGILESAESGQSDTAESGIQRVADDLAGLHAKANFCDYDHYNIRGRFSFMTGRR